jgi:hypothetical protein
MQMTDRARKVRDHRPQAHSDQGSTTFEPGACANWQAGREAADTRSNDRRDCFGYDVLVCMVSASAPGIW